MKRFPRMDKGVRDSIAMSMHMAVEVLLAAPDSKVFTDVTKQLAIMSAAVDYGASVRIKDRTDDYARAICSALEACEGIQARHAAKGVWGVSGDEINRLRAAVFHFDEALKLIPWPVYQSAQQFVDERLSQPHIHHGT